MANQQNIEPYKFKKGDLSSEEAARRGSLGGKESVKARKENKLIKDRILERMGESDWDVMIDNLIARAQEDTKSFETLRDTIGQKPKDTVAVENEHIIIRRHRNDD